MALSQIRKTSAQLREDFVRACCKFHLGPEVEEWLDAQRSATTADLIRWISCLNRIEEALDEQELNIPSLLAQYADPMDLGAPETEGVVGALFPVLANLRESIAYPISATVSEAFASEADALLHCQFHDADSIFVVSGETITARDRPVVGFLYAVFTAWTEGGPHARAARRFLCELLQTCITDTHHSAEEKFAQAVAITVDDNAAFAFEATHVMVVDATQRVWVFEGSSFLGSKLLLPAYPSSWPGSIKSYPEASQIVGLLQRNDRVHLSYGGESVLIIPHTDCHDPLPEGGVLMR